MAEKFNPDDTLSPIELAQHLRQPTGDIGIQIGDQMNKGNKHISLNTYKVLNPHDGNHILEIGMGNGFFIPDLLAMAKNLSYTGIDFSATMVKEANRINEDLVNSGTVQFKCASIENIPFPDNSFDCIATANTLYFWPQPEDNLKELFRVLKPNGKFICAYRSKSCMDNVDFTQYGFTKYDKDSVESLFRNSGFIDVTTEIIKEPELEFDGKTHAMEGIFTIGLKNA
ncbi:class I SAM-dependent methyltransferase [Seonamhaeicola sp. MEBiC1930]|uniref:class I SAM-dependent methyltransferase n=1 Tax=Seonamhaeicola sp. MEBiC01930 TaxID=2976768 RepID=UPI00324E35A4